MITNKIKRHYLFFALLLSLVCAKYALAETTIFPPPLECMSLEECLGNFLSKITQLVPILAIIFIVIGGILYMTSYGNESRITRAKACITGAVIGLSITLAAPAFLEEIQTILGGKRTGHITLAEIAGNTLSFLLSIVGLLAIISFIIGGMMYMTAYGDTGRIDTAKKIVKNSVIGLVVSLSALIIVKQIAALIQ